MKKEVQVYNDGDLVFEGLLDEFLETNKEEQEFILSHIDFNKESSEFHEISGHWKIIFR